MVRAINPPHNWDSIDAVQRFIVEWADDRFPNRTDYQALSKLVLEEIPEMLQARKEGAAGLEGEVADAFILLLDLCHLWKIDIQEGLRKKMTENLSRHWIMDPVSGLHQHKEVT